MELLAFKNAIRHIFWINTTATSKENINRCKLFKHMTSTPIYYIKHVFASVCRYACMHVYIYSHFISPEHYRHNAYFKVHLGLSDIIWDNPARIFAPLNIHHIWKNMPAYTQIRISEYIYGLRYKHAHTHNHTHIYTYW